MLTILSSDFFVKQENLIPDFTSYYTGFGDPNSWTPDGSLANVQTKPAIINGRPSIIFTKFQGQAANGLPSSKPVAAVEIILQQQDDGRFVDVTKKLLGAGVGENGFKLNSGPAQVLVASVDGMLNPLIVIAQNCDDGRDNGNDFAANLAISQIQIPQPDGTYKTLDLGKPAFGDEGSIHLIESADGVHIYLSGYQADPASVINITTIEGTSIFLQKNQVYLFRPEDGSIRALEPSVGVQSGSAILESNIIVTQFDEWSNAVRSVGVGLVERNGVNEWELRQKIQPFDYKVITNYKAWTGAEGSIQVFDVDGQLVAGVFRVLDSFTGRAGENQHVLTAVTGQKLSPMHADGYYYESDYKPFAAFQFWDYVDGRLVESTLHLINPNTDVNIGGIQQIDVDHNGLIDLVVNNWNFTGQPDVYLNDGAGDLYHVPLSEFPVFDADYVANATFVDLGDQKWGLLYQKEGVTKYNYTNATPEIYFSSRPLTILEDVKILDRNQGAIIATWAGNDLIKDEDANAITDIDGGSGIDTVSYSGKLNNYAISGGGSSTFEVKSNSDLYQLHDTLSHIERLQFSDINVALDIDKGEIAGSAYRIYKAAFDRAPDAGGLGFWINAMDDGASLNSVAGGFINSPEFQKLYGANVSDRDYVTKLYNNVLDRNPDHGGYDFWLGALANGASREDILVNFSESKENIANVAELIANGIQYQEWLG